MPTEAEARETWCPFARQIILSRDGDWVGAANRALPQELGNSDPRCLASGCAAWRWANKRNPDYDENLQWSGDDPRNDMYIEDREHGYCGLAGKP